MPDQPRGYLVDHLQGPGLDTSGRVLVCLGCGCLVHPAHRALHDGTCGDREDAEDLAQRLADQARPGGHGNVR